MDPTYLAARHTPSTFNHERQRLSAVLKPALEQLELANPVLRIPQQTTKAVLHQPFESVAGFYASTNSAFSSLSLNAYGTVRKDQFSVIFNARPPGPPHGQLDGVNLPCVRSWVVVYDPENVLA